MPVKQDMALTKPFSMRKKMFQTMDKFFLVAAFASFVGSVSLWFLVNNDYGIFVGIWVPSILALWTGIRICLLDFTRDISGKE